MKTNPTNSFQTASYLCIKIWYHTEKTNNKRNPSKKCHLKKMLIILATYFFLVHMIHLELMLFGTKGEIFPQNIAYDKFGIIWHYYEIINKKWTSSDTNGSHKRLIIFLSCFQLEHIINPKLVFLWPIMAYFSKRVHMIKSISYGIKFKDKQEALIVWKFSLIKKLTCLDSCFSLAHMKNLES